MIQRGASRRGQSSVLIIHQGALGDVVACFPSIKKINSFHKVDILSKSSIGELACAIGLAERAFPVESAVFSTAFSEVSDNRLRRWFEPYEQILLFSFSEQLAQGIRRKTDKKVHLIPPRPPTAARIQVARFISEKVRACGLVSNSDGASNKDGKTAPLPPAGDGSGRILIHPGSGSWFKNWPLSNFIGIARQLLELGISAEFILGPAESRMAEPIQAELGRLSCIHQTDSIVGLWNELKRADGFVGNDSGVSHLAGYIGLPTIVIFGPSDPQRWAPYGQNVLSISLDYPCQPCFEISDRGCLHRRCLEHITSEKVCESLKLTLQQVAASKRG